MSKRKGNTNSLESKKQALEVIVEAAKNSGMEISDIPRETMKKLTEIDLPTEILQYIIFLIQQDDLVEFLKYGHRFALVNRQFRDIYTNILNQVFSSGEIIENADAACILDRMKPKKSIREFGYDKACNEIWITKEVSDYFIFKLKGRIAEGKQGLKNQPMHGTPYIEELKRLYFLGDSLVSYFTAFSPEKEFLVETDKGIKSIPFININTKNISNIVLYPCGCIPVNIYFTDPIESYFGDVVYRSKFVSIKSYFTISNVVDRLGNLIFDSHPNIQPFLDKLELYGEEKNIHTEEERDVFKKWKITKVGLNYKHLNTNKYRITFEPEISVFLH